MALDLGLRGKVAIVTGGSRGIGRAICLALADEGCNVAFCARGEERLRETGVELKQRSIETLGVAMDVTKEGAIESFVESTAGELGRIDILVNNVGGARHVDEDEAWREATEVNVIGAVRASRAAVPHMRAQGGGSIIHIASIYGRESGGSLPYNAAKAAMISHAKNLALQLAPDGIRVNSDIVTFLASERSGWVTGVSLNVDGGQSRSNI